MRDGVVDEAVCKRHVRDIVHFIVWLHKNKEDWMTAHGLKLCRETNVLETEGEKKRVRQKRIIEMWVDAVCQSSTQAIVNMEKLTPEGVMDFTSCQAHQRTGRRLLQAGCNGKRSAVQHLM